MMTGTASHPHFQHIRILIDPILNLLLFSYFRFALHKIEQELGTEIKPIPKVIDPHLYVAEYQTEGSFESNDLKSTEQQQQQSSSASTTATTTSSSSQHLQQPHLQQMVQAQP